ncbi:hypothetical protein D3C84_999680 [compost metagenome]
MHLHAVVACAEGHVAIDGAAAIGGKGQTVIARQVGQRTAAGTVTPVIVVAVAGCQRATPVGGVRPTEKNAD